MRRKLLLLTAALTSAFVLAAVAHAAVREVGDTANFTVPPCDGNDCQVLTRTTALPAAARHTQEPQPRPGAGQGRRILALPADQSARSSTRTSPTPSAARRPRASPSCGPSRKRGVAYRYALVDQSERINLRKYLTGNMASFALAKPIAVKRGDVIAITTDTWMPAFRRRPERNQLLACKSPEGQVHGQGRPDHAAHAQEDRSDQAVRLRLHGCAASVPRDRRSTTRRPSSSRLAGGSRPVRRLGARLGVQPLLASVLASCSASSARCISVV